MTTKAVQERVYQRPVQQIWKRRTRRILVAWRAAIVQARLDEDSMTPGQYVNQTKELERIYDLWNEFEYLTIRKGYYMSDLLKQVCKEGMDYILRGE